MSSADHIITHAMELPRTERARVARELLGSLHDAETQEGVEAAWVEELQARIADAGVVDFEDWSTVQARVRAKLSTIRK